MRVSLPPGRSSLGLSLGLLAACSGSQINQPPPPITNCTTVAPTVLAAGGSTIIDPTPANINGCLVLPAASPAGAEYLVTAVSTAGQVTTNGNFGTYAFTGSPATAPGLASSMLLGAFAPPTSPQQFHRMLREREKALAKDPATHLFRATSLTTPTPPTVGSQRSFQVCAQAQCSSFVTVTATAEHVGPRGAIYLDNGWLTSYIAQDIDTVGTLFDSYMYPIDTTAFGRESDLDNNGVVVVLLTHAVNDLSVNSQVNGVILGYFFGNDLTNGANSNLGEVFYGLVPDPGGTCPISSTFAKKNIVPTFIHEFQHMISFNRHVLLPPVPSLSEETWLNEGLSHYAEELGGAQIPDAECQPPSCLNQFVSGDFGNAAGYMQAPENTFVISPDTSFGSLDERGSEWLFVRWMAEHFATDTILGTTFTRALDGADSPNGLTLLGDANVTAATGTPFTTLIPQWQMANYLESLAGFSEATGRLRYRVLGVGGQLDPRIFYLTHGGVYPLRVDSTKTASYNRQGILRAGSGVHLRVIQPASGTAVALQLTTSNTAAIVPRFGVIRIK